MAPDPRPGGMLVAPRRLCASKACHAGNKPAWPHCRSSFGAAESRPMKRTLAFAVIVSLRTEFRRRAAPPALDDKPRGAPRWPARWHTPAARVRKPFANGPPAASSANSQGQPRAQVVAVGGVIAESRGESLVIGPD